MSEKIVQLNEEVIKGQIKELVRGSVEETLNELLEKEAESLTQAARYERSEARQGYRSGHYDRCLTTTSGDVTLHMPRLKGVSFETAIIERYRRRESSVEEALIEMYLAGVSVRRVEDITEALWGSKVSPATISELNKKAYVHIEDWRNRPLQGGRYPYVSSSATSAWRWWRPWARCSWAPNTSAAQCISIAMFSLLCLNPRSKLWQECSRQSTHRRAKRRPATRLKQSLPRTARHEAEGGCWTALRKL